MSETFIIVRKTLWKIPVCIFLAFLLLNMWSLYIVYYNVSNVAFVTQQVIMQNNGIPDEYKDSIQEMLEFVVDSSAATSLSMTTRLNDSTVDVISNSQVTTPVGYTPAEFGDTIMVDFNFRFKWAEPIRTGEANGADETLYTVQGAGIYDGTDAPTQGLVYTGGDTRTLNCHLVYEIPCIRYYPAQ